MVPSEHALREEARLALAMSEIADRAEPWHGGVRCVTAGVPWATGLFGAVGEVPPGAVDELLAWFGDAPARIELGPFAHRTLLDQLAPFHLLGFEQVYVHTLAAVAPAQAAGITVRATDDAETWIAVSSAGFRAEGAPLPDAERAVLLRMVRHPQVHLYGAFDGDRMVGAGAVEIRGTQANLIATSVAATHRGRGAQSALIAHRLAAARAAGASFAYISSEPGVATERNALRAGFALAYTKVQLAAR